MNKLFGFWKNSTVKDPIASKLNPQPVVKDGVPEFLNQTRGVRNTHVTRRQIVLNRHFTEIISDVLANSLKKQLNEMNVTITSIETKAWNKGVNVFYSTGQSFDESLHNELNSLVGQLRYAITERRLIGRTPHINFVFDRTAYLSQKLDETIDRASEVQEDEDKSLISAQFNQLYISKDLGTQEPKLISKRFSAPEDMDNTLLGLNYPLLYDEIALKLERGRGESSRMISSTSLFSSSKPLFRAPSEDHDNEDPTTRILRMKKFLINQRKKSEYLSMQRRKGELLNRDNYKWDLPGEDEQDREESQETKEEYNDVR